MSVSLVLAKPAGYNWKALVFVGTVGLIPRESVERLSSNFYIQRNLILGNYINLKKKFNILDPCLYLTDKSSRQKVFGWYWGVDFLTEKQCLISNESIWIRNKI